MTCEPKNVNEPTNHAIFARWLHQRVGHSHTQGILRFVEMSCLCTVGFFLWTVGYWALQTA